MNNKFTDFAKPYFDFIDRVFLFCSSFKFVYPKIGFLLLMISTSSCGVGDGQTILNVSISNHPDSGFAVEQLSANIKTKRDFIDKSSVFQTVGEPRAISLTIEWWWQSGDFEQRKLVASERVSVNEEFASFRTTYSAPENHVLLNYYWVKIKWEDDNGNEVIESRKAYCRYKSYENISNSKYKAL